MNELNVISEPVVVPTETGLMIDDGLSFDQWSSIGENFGKALRKARWCIGDWMVYGERMWGRQLIFGGADFDPKSGKVSTEIFNRAVTSTGMDRHDLSQIAWVCRKIPNDERDPRLSFEHYKALAPLGDSERSEWIKLLLATTTIPNKSRLRDSIRLSPGIPRIVTDDEVMNQRELSGVPNYGVYFHRLTAILEDTIPLMDDEQREAARLDSRPLAKLLASL